MKKTLIIFGILEALVIAIALIVYLLEYRSLIEIQDVLFKSTLVLIVLLVLSMAIGKLMRSNPS